MTHLRRQSVPKLYMIKYSTLGPQSSTLPPGRNSRFESFWEENYSEDTNTRRKEEAIEPPLSFAVACFEAV